MPRPRPRTCKQIKMIREKLNFKTLIDLRSEKELAMDDQKNGTVYEGQCFRSLPSCAHTHLHLALPKSFGFCSDTPHTRRLLPCPLALC